MAWNQRPASPGMGGRFAVESVTGMAWNTQIRDDYRLLSCYWFVRTGSKVASNVSHVVSGPTSLGQPLLLLTFET